jgi:hypothetical protein
MPAIRCSGSPTLGRLLDRIVARVRARSIDDRLLAGEPPDATAELRRARLLDPGYRSAVADALRNLVEAAENAEHNYFRAQIPIRRTEVLEARSLILSLADQVEGDPSVTPRGVILADRLIRDGASPVYWRSDLSVEPTGETVESAVKHALAALHLG